MWMAITNLSWTYPDVHHHHHYPAQHRTFAEWTSLIFSIINTESHLSWMDHLPIFANRNPTERSVDCFLHCSVFNVIPGRNMRHGKRAEERRGERNYCGQSENSTFKKENEKKNFKYLSYCYSQLLPSVLLWIFLLGLSIMYPTTCFSLSEEEGMLEGWAL